MPATQPASLSAQGETLLIDGKPITFPRVILHAESTGGGVAVRFNTLDGPAEEGNAIHFDLTLDDIDDPANLPGAAWHFRNDDTERAETLNGISLDGRAVVLEPADVSILFSRDANAVTIDIDGQFGWFDPPDAEKPLKLVSISGRLVVKMP